MIFYVDDRNSDSRDSFSVEHLMRDFALEVKKE
jgi:hypothetical protein